jgi:hypothetical protein
MLIRIDFVFREIKKSYFATTLVGEPHKNYVALQNCLEDFLFLYYNFSKSYAEVTHKNRQSWAQFFQN